MRVPDSPVPIRAWRVWGVRGSLLQSSAAGFLTGMPVWAPYEPFAARCLGRRPCPEAPEAVHGCGVHAFSDEADARDWAGHMSRVRPIVLGEVSLWGRVVACGRGWRAELAYPAALHEVVRRRRQPEPDLAVLSAAYGL